MSSNNLSETWGGKIVIALLLLIILLTIGFTAVGVYYGEALGYMAVSALPSAGVLVLSILFAYRVKRGSLTLVKVAWTCFSVFILLFVIVAIDVQSDSGMEGAGLVVSYSMAIMSFPSCFLAVFVYAAVSYLLGVSTLADSFNFPLLGPYAEIGSYWLGLFIAGYLQWFKLAPFLIERWESRRPQGEG